MSARAELPRVPGFIPVRQPIDVGAAVRYLREQSIADYGAESDVDVLQANNGMSNPTYLFRSRRDPDARQLVIRKKPPGKVLPGAHQIEREYRVMSALAKADSRVPVPRVHALCEDESVLGRGFYVMDFVRGRVIDTDQLGAMPPAHRRAIFDRLSEILARLHRIDPDAAGLGSHGKRGNYAARQLKTWGRQFQRGLLAIEAAVSKHPDAPVVMAATPRMEALIARLKRMAPSASDESVLVHGDFRLGNVILHPTEPEVLAVIDWEISTLGHPIPDLAYLMMPWYVPGGFSRGLHGAASDSGGMVSAGAVPEGVPTEAEYLEAYCRRAGRPVVPPAEWAFWKALTLFRIAAINHGVFARALAGNAGSSKALNSGPTVPIFIALAHFTLDQAGVPPAPAPAGAKL